MPYLPQIECQPLDSRIVTDGLDFPEGPIAMPDGTIVLVEIRGQRLTRIHPDGGKETVAELPGGPNGAAIGPDGRIYVCNNGGFAWQEMDGYCHFPVGTPDSYRTGSIDCVDPATGRVERLYDDTADGRLGGPNDLVFDDHGGFWFTDPGKAGRRDTGDGAVWYGKADGSLCRKVVRHLASPNGISLSDDGRRLYIIEALTARLWVWDVPAPGEIAPAPFPSPHGGRFVGNASGFVRFDSMTLDAAENACIGTLFDAAGITVISRDGERITHLQMDDPLVTNICFGGPGLLTAYMTCSATGTLRAAAWDVPGMPLPYLDRPARQQAFA